MYHACQMRKHLSSSEGSLEKRVEIRTVRCQFLSKAAMIVDISNIIKTETSSGGELSEHHTGSSLQIREAFSIYLYIYRTDRGSYREMMN